MGARLLADENVPRAGRRNTSTDGHDVLWMHEEAFGTPDPEVLARAHRERRVVVTFDKDFGEFAFRLGAAAASGVILCRVHAGSPESVARAAVSVFAERTDWAGAFVVVEDGRIRVRSIADRPAQ